MKRIASKLCLALLVAGFCTASAEAAKYSQLPKGDVSYGSYDFASETASLWITADDWVCPDGTPIGGIRWWGSYWATPAPGVYVSYSDMLNGAAPGMVTSFMIGICPNLPPDADVPFDHPPMSAPLAVWTVPIADAHEEFAFTVHKSALVTENVYSYYADLTKAEPVLGMPDAPFPQVQGEKYWLVIAAQHQDQNTQWGWHEADGHWGSYAVQTAQAPVLWVPCGGHDMAFELIAVPEPGSIAACAVGLVGLAGFAGMRRRRAM